MAALLRVLILVASISALAPPTRADARIVCPGSEVVELRPGYPSYRGFVTGLVGEGETACLDYLEDLDPSFDIDNEDLANLSAARSLGVWGDSDDWPWEVWMAVEVERNLPLTCYSCLLLDPPFPPQMPTFGADPRIMMGGFGQSWIATRVCTDLNVTYAIPNVPADYEVRAIIGLANPGMFIPASEAIPLYEETISSYFEPGQFIDPTPLMRTLADQGGYVPVSEDLLPPDQVFVVAMGIFAMRTLLVEFAYNALLGNFDAMVTGWESELMTNPSAPSFSEWLGDNDFFGAWT